ncbi:MAG: tRNA uridine-5-carboxymethylaminomethyl(34) synthesis GTPase MnmE, partial [Candidatus Hydrogenedentes bacterium]|nr:tRNA uridine-5-carboxymethylaminomethyl(34) synthesis GTPase MnmE [Candidatus Hydrogenedentota bacterium]
HTLRRGMHGIECTEDNFGKSPEFMAIEIDEALRALGEITGETTPDEVLEHIFSSFCIGK